MGRPCGGKNSLIFNREGKMSRGKRFSFLTFLCLFMYLLVGGCFEPTQDQSWYSYRGVTYGTTRQEAEKQLGPPSKQSPSELFFGYLLVQYQGGITVAYSDDGRVRNITLPEHLGLKVNDPVQKVRQILGKGEKIKTPYGSQYYILHFGSGDGRDLWFLIAEGKINGIQIGELLAD